MDLNEIRKLIRLMEKAELSELEIDDSKEGLRVHLRRGSGGEGAAASPVVHVVPGAAPAPAPAVLPAASAAGAPEAEGPGDGLPPGAVPFLSPMVGTFYRSPSPDSDPYVEVGSRVDEDAVLCIVEAMKVMNEIRAEARGEILEVLVENGEPVEFGQPLFHIKPL